MAPSAGYSQYICVYVRNQTNTHGNCLKRFIFMLNSRESLENELTTTQNGKIQAEHAANMFCVLKLFKLFVRIDMFQCDTAQTNE